MRTNFSPLYSSSCIDRPAFQLRYAWTGWPSTGAKFPARPSEEFFRNLFKLWETDGIRYLESTWSPEEIQFTCSVLPTVNPVLFTTRIKGRLDHALRTTGQPVQFSRKVSFRTIGENSREEAEAYIAKQVRKEQFVDPRFSELLESFTYVNPEVCLKEPIATNSGRYWYNLHLVLVTEGRMRMNDRDSLTHLSQMCDAIASKKGYRVSARSLMPDHIHLALSGDIEQSPEEIALAHLNNTAYGFGQKLIWRPGYYVGTFGEYDMGAVRHNR